MERNKKLFIDKRGYTLIEMLVAMLVFSVVITVVLGLFSIAIKGQRRVIAQQNVQENARYLLEFMAKEIRMSKITAGNGQSSGFSFVRSDSASVIYSIYGGKLYRNDSPISSEEVVVSGYFYVEGVGAGATDNQQPKVTITLRLQGAGSRQEEKLIANIQTTLSQRNLDL